MFKSINEERKTFSRKVMEHIQDLIASGQLQTGDKLPAERELAEMMDVSRPTIREAFKVLSAMGLLEIKHGHGVFIADRSTSIDKLASLLFLQTDTIRELFDVRKMIETETAAHAANRGTAPFLEQILASTRENHRKVVDNEFANQAELEQFLAQSDQEFHLMIAEAAGNEVVIRIMNHLIDLLRESRMRSIKIPGRPLQSLNEHILVAEAMVARDSAMARTRMFNHLSSVEHTLLGEFE